ncbi:hypothetical protein KAR48_17970 [bacterium]|nr:hypothetical protein [bacterium]
MDRYTFGKILAQLHGLPMEQFDPISINDVEMQAPRPVDASLDISLAQSVLNTELRGISEGLREA